MLLPEFLDMVYDLILTFLPFLITIRNTALANRENGRGRGRMISHNLASCYPISISRKKKLIKSACGEKKMRCAITARGSFTRTVYSAINVLTLNKTSFSYDLTL